MANLTPFSTGKLRVGPLGVTLSDSDNLINIQNVQFNQAFQEALVRTAAHINQYPTADAQYDGDITVTFETVSLPEALLPYIMGVSSVSAGGYRVYTGTATAKPAYHQWEFITQDPDGKQVIINLPRVKTNAFNPNMARDAFMTNSFTSHSLPKDSYAPFIFKVQE